jgi:hypothetical protein
MKKILIGSIVLTLFSASTILLQISCQKGFNAQTTVYTLPPATNSTLGGVIVGSGLTVGSTGVLSLSNSTGIQQNLIIFVRRKPTSPFIYEIWASNYDGSKQNIINISLPVGFSISEEGRSPKLSPDGKTLFFHVANATYSYIYSCNIDGSNVKKVVDGASYENISLGGAY